MAAVTTTTAIHLAMALLRSLTGILTSGVGILRMAITAAEAITVVAGIMVGPIPRREVPGTVRIRQTRRRATVIWDPLEVQLAAMAVMAAVEVPNMTSWNSLATVLRRFAASVTIMAARFARLVSSRLADLAIRCSSAQLPAAIRLPASVIVGLLCLPVSTVAISVDAEYEIESIAIKEWKDIANEELIYVFREYFGEGRLSKFRPRNCALRIYNDIEIERRDRIEETIAVFEQESSLQEYGYSITSPPDECKGGSLVIGVYKDSVGEDRFFG